MVSEATIKRSKQVKNLGKLCPCVKDNDQTIYVNPTLLFQRLFVLIERVEDMTCYFQYELSSEPTSLFKDGFMQKGNKSSLGRVLTKKILELELTANDSTKYIIDGGALLHMVYWNIPAIYRDVINQYYNLVLRKYGDNCSLMFDGYRFLTKDHEHQRKSKHKYTGVMLQLDNDVLCKQSDFLSNDKNKTQFIELVGCVQAVTM